MRGHGTPTPGGVGAYDHEYWRQIGVADPFTAYYAAGMISRHGRTIRELASDQLVAHPIVFPRGGTLDQLATFVSNYFGVDALEVRLGLYTATSTTNLYPNTLIVDSGAIVINSNGLKTAAIATVVQPNVLYWGVVLGEDEEAESGCDLFATEEPYECQVGGVSNTFVPQSGLMVAQAYGPLPNPFPAGAVWTADEWWTPLMRFSA